jgi:hypothetical protein
MVRGYQTPINSWQGSQMPFEHGSCALCNMSTAINLSFCGEKKTAQLGVFLTPPQSVKNNNRNGRSPDYLSNKPIWKAFTRHSV